jgi:putative Holliday junction resolvase
MLLHVLALLMENQRIIGLDVGSAAIGVALSDFTGTVATPLVVLDRQKFLPELKKIIAEKRATKIVIGLPLQLDGGKGPRYQSTKAFGRNLAKEIDLPIDYHDERFSSAVVERAMLEADLSRKRRNELSDKLAASYILQGYLELKRL